MKRTFGRTRLRNAGTNGSTLKTGARQIQGLLQTLHSLEFHVAKALGGLCQLVLHDPDICDAAAGKEIGDIIRSCVERQVSNVGSKRRLGGEVKRLSNGVSTTGFTF